jgi:hypothetical protein
VTPPGPGVARPEAEAEAAEPDVAQLDEGSGIARPEEEPTSELAEAAEARTIEFAAVPAEALAASPYADPTEQLSIPPAPERPSRLAASVRRALRNPWAPRIALMLLVTFSIASKGIDLSQPCKAPCKPQNAHTLIFDEAYYINAARVIDHIEPPKSAHYHGAPKGDDPNAEHPQLAKLAIAAGIKIFGNNPLGWRIGSIVFGVIALLALYWLVIAAGGSDWLAAGTAAVMSLDNLMFVHSRIATLDIYAVAMMIVAALLYMRKRPLLAGLALGVAACMKETALFLVFVFILLEALRIARAWMGRDDSDFDRPEGAEGPRIRYGASHRGGPGPWGGLGRHGAAAITVSDGARWRHLPSAPTLADRARAAAATARQRLPKLGLFLLAGAAGTLGLLWLLDVLVPAYDPGTHKLYDGNPFSHLAHMYNYAQLLKAKPYETGFASPPLDWLFDQKTIKYASVVVETTVKGKLVGSHATISFIGEINPFIIFLAVPGLFAALAAAWRSGDGVAALGACWCLGTYLPLVIGDLASDRVSYIYYMLAVMPGVYLVTTRLFAGKRLPPAAAVGWAIMLVYSFVRLYPIHTLL